MESSHQINIIIDNFKFSFVCAYYKTISKEPFNAPLNEKLLDENFLKEKAKEILKQSSQTKSPVKYCGLSAECVDGLLELNFTPLSTNALHKIFE